MKCPNCGAKLYIADSVLLPSGEERYRIRFCKECGEVVYTTEYIVEKTEAFMRSWAENHRKHFNCGEPRQRKPRYTEAQLKYIKNNCYGNYKVIAAQLGKSEHTVKKYMWLFRKEKESKKK